MATTSILKSKRNIVEEPVEKPKGWEFMDTECRVDNKTFFKWNNLFQEFQCKEFLVLLQDDPSTELSKGIYKNISRSRLHRAVAKTPVLPCQDVIEWMNQRIDHERRIILNFEDKDVASTQALMLNQLYHFKESQVRVTLEWLQSKTKSINFLSIMKGWWSEG